MATLTEQAEEVQARMQAGTATGDDYAFLGKLSLAAIDVAKSLGTENIEKAAKKADDDEDAAESKSDDGDGDDSDGDAGDDGDASDEGDGDDSMGKGVPGTDADPVLEEEEEPGEIAKSMLSAIEEGGHEDAEAYFDCEPVMKSIGAGLDRILTEQRAFHAKIEARLTRVEKSLKGASPAPAAAPAAAAAPVEVPAETPEAKLTKAVQAGMAEQLGALLEPFKNRLDRLDALEEAFTRLPFSPHSNGLHKGAGGGGGNALVGEHITTEMAVSVLEKAMKSNAITQDECTTALDIMGEHKHPIMEVVKRCAPGALPLLKSASEAATLS